MKSAGCVKVMHAFRVVLLRCSFSLSAPSVQGLILSYLSLVDDGKMDMGNGEMA